MCDHDHDQTQYQRVDAVDLRKLIPRASDDCMDLLYVRDISNNSDE